MNHSLKTRVLSLVLAVIMVVGLLPMNVFATEAQEQSTTPETATVTFDVNGGIGEYDAQVVTVGDKVTKPEQDPTHETSIFAYWTADLKENVEWDFEENAVTEDMTLYAVWSAPVVLADTDGVSYTVEHHLEGADGKFVKDASLTETLTGTAGEKTKAAAKKITNYTAKAITQKDITADGKTVVVVQYSRNLVEYTVNHYLRYADGTEFLSQTVKEKLGWGKMTQGSTKYEGTRTTDKVEVALNGSTVINVYYDVTYTTNKHGLPSEMDIITNEDSTLAPGVTMNEIALYDKNGKRVEMQITTSDTSVDTVHFYANYMDNQISTWGLQTLSEQVAAMEANYEEPFKIVAGINASYYNTTTGKPTGAFVMEGIDVTSEEEGNAHEFFAVLNDGTVMIGAKGEYSKYKGQIKEAIGGYAHLVRDGAICAGLDKTTKYPRQTLGITADGKVITMTADGSQTQTVGLTYYEQAAVMQALGCVEAIHLDGGNSATFGAIREGTDKFVTVNSPSGMAERAVSNTFVIVSTAVADGTFDHAVISGEYEYQVPYTTTTYSAIGVDAANGVAELPETAIWTLSDDSFGTIENGVFVSNGKTGDVNIQLSDNGKVVGSKTIHVVNPTAISFGADEATVPYGKSASLTVIAMYNNNEAFCEATNFDWTINPAAAGTLNGFEFAACDDESVTSGVITATYKYTELDPAFIKVKFGKGSEVLFDFEDGDISDWRGIDTIYEWIDEKNAANPDAKYPVDEPLNGYSNGIEKQTSSVFLATEENGGKVKNGKYSLGFRMNHKNVTDIGGWLYNYLYYTGETKVLRDVANGVNGIRIGMWVHTDTTNVAFRIVRGRTEADGTKKIGYSYMKSGYDEANVSYATNYGIPESGWIYVYYNLTDLADTIRQTTSLYDPDKNNGCAFGPSKGANYYPAFLQFFTGSATDVPQEMIFYIDDITLDYSEVTDDRDAPVISNMTVSTDGSNDVALNGQTVSSNQLSFSASIADKSGNANMTGLDYTTAKIYVDGIDMSGNAGFKAVNGIVSLNNVNLTNGEHSVAFVVCDKQGNETRVTKTLTVAGSVANAVVSAVGRNEGNHTPKAGSVYYIDIKTSDAAQIGTVTTTLKLDKSNRFEYQNIVCADGITATVSFDELDREVTVTLTHDGSLSGEAVLASVPIRVWAWDEATTGITADKQFASGAIPSINIEWKTTYGRVTYADDAFSNYVAGFYGAENIATELDNKTAWHKHTASAMEDKPADCTHAGYTGRTYCEGCASVIDWGTTVPAIGHTYEIIDGILKCACGETFTGIWEEDGKEYVDGVAMADGWVGESYYKDGKKLTGIHKVPAPDASSEFYYNFGEDGVCKNGAKYEGIFFDEEENVYRYSKLGVLSSGWFLIENEWYYFDPVTNAAATGTYQYNDIIVYEFAENGKITKGFWEKRLTGMRYFYGPGNYKNDWYTIDGKDYFFKNGYRVEGGYQLTSNISNEKIWYFFEEDGSCDRTKVIPDGFYTDRNGYGYSLDGKAVHGVQIIDGVRYYFDYKGYAQTGKHSGYLFGEDYKGVTGIVEENSGKYYYENGKRTMAGLVEVDGDYYFASGDGAIVTDRTIYVWKANGIIPESDRTFDAEGKLVDGIIERDGNYYYYNMGKPEMAGLVEVDGDYYFAKNGDGLLVTDCTTYVWKANGIIPESERTFGPDGKMYNGIVEIDGGYYYYNMGKAEMAGLICIDGDYYFAKDGKGTIVTNCVYYNWKSNGLLPAAEYEYGPDGKMLNGIVEIDGGLYYYENGKPTMKGLFEFNGDYYFAKDGKGTIVTNCVYWNWKGNGLLPAAEYEYGPDGKMLDGIVERDGGYYYYETGKPKMAGLIEVDGDYYFARDGKGTLVTNGTYYMWKANGIVPASDREFGPDGKMLNGIVERDGNYYYYNMGKPEMAGLIEIDGNYYFAKDGDGLLVTDCTYYIWKTNGILPESERMFGEDGKMLDGFVTKDDGIYYYEDGKFGTPGLNYIDGYYYFVGYDGKLVVNRTYYVWKPNGYCIPGEYTFDAQGRIIL